MLAILLGFAQVPVPQVLLLDFISTMLLGRWIHEAAANSRVHCLSPTPPPSTASPLKPPHTLYPTLPLRRLRLHSHHSLGSAFCYLRGLRVVSKFSCR